MINPQPSVQFVNPLSVRVDKAGSHLLITLPGNVIIRKPINYFRAILRNLDNRQIPEPTKPE